MAQLVKPIIEIEGVKRITNVGDLRITQDAFKQHSFIVDVSIDVLEKKDEMFFHSAHKDVCGKPITISFEPALKDASFNFQFKGIVTQIILDNVDDLTNIYSIRGQSPDFLLEDCAMRRSFLNKTLQQIFETVLTPYPGNLLKKKLKPNFKGKIKYAVQYDETNLAFLGRLANEYGEWFFYNGAELVLGDPGSKEIDFFINGKQTFNMFVGLKLPPKFQMQAYDYTKDQKYKGKSSSQQVQTLGTFSKFTLDESESLFSQESLFQAPFPVYSQSELDDFIKMRRSGTAGQMVVFQGQGEIPELTVGNVVNVTGTRLQKGEKIKKENLGKYRLISIEHKVDKAGNYSNEFNAIPESLKMPPTIYSFKTPVGQPELAVVTDNEDPDKLGRVKVEFFWPGDDKSSDWIRVGMFYSGGGDIGMHFIPEKEAQVMVAYEMGKPDRPFVLTQLYAKKGGTRALKGSNDEKIIHTKAGNQIVLIDKQGENSILITNANKKETNILLEFKDNGQISIKTEGKVVVEAKQTISIKADDKITMEGKDIEIKASNELKLTGTSKVTVSGMEIKANADTKVEIKSIEVEVKADATAKISAPVVEVSADGILTLKGGGMVKIN